MEHRAANFARTILLLGIGPDNFRLTYGRYLGLAAWDSRVHANNTYLEVLVGMGAIGAAALRLADRRRVPIDARPASRRRSRDDAACRRGDGGLPGDCRARRGRFVPDLYVNLRASSPWRRGSSTDMRIAFDGTTLTPGRTGVGYYTEHLLQHLAREVDNTGDEIVVVSNKPIDTERPLPPHVRVHEGHRFPVRIGWMQMRAARALEALRPDVAHFTNGMIPIGSPVSTIVTIHDMSLRLYPHCHPVRRLLLNRPLMHVAIRQAASIVTVSHSARRDLLRFHGVPPDRVAVVHEAASPAFRPIDDRATLDRVRAQYGLPSRFVLYVGTIEPRKNLSRLVDAFAMRPRPRHSASSGVRGTVWMVVARPGRTHRTAWHQGRRSLHRLRSLRRSAGDLQPRRLLRLSVAV